MRVTDVVSSHAVPSHVPSGAAAGERGKGRGGGTGKGRGGGKGRGARGKSGGSVCGSAAAGAGKENAKDTCGICTRADVPFDQTRALSDSEAVALLQYQGTPQQRDRASPNSNYKKFEDFHLTVFDEENKPMFKKKLTLTEIEAEMWGKTLEILENGVCLYECQCRTPKYLIQIHNPDVAWKLASKGLTDQCMVQHLLPGEPGRVVPTWYLPNKLRERFWFVFGSKLRGDVEVEDETDFVLVERSEEEEHDESEGEAEDEDEPQRQNLQLLSEAQDWSRYPDPILPQAPHRILFLGANNPNEPQLWLEEEVGKMKDSFMLAKGSQWWRDKGEVVFQQKLLAGPSDVTWLLKEQDPIILHLACHRQGKTLRLFGKSVEEEQLVQYIRAWAAEGNRLRLVIANTCAGADIAQDLSSYVDFAIGPNPAVNDVEATEFSKAFYGHLGAGYSLQLSFAAGKFNSKAYCLFARKNATAFRLIPPATSTDAQVSFPSNLLACLTSTPPPKSSTLIYFFIHSSTRVHARAYNCSRISFVLVHVIFVNPVTKVIGTCKYHDD